MVVIFAFKCNSNVISSKSVSSANCSCQWLVWKHMHIVLNILERHTLYVFWQHKEFSPLLFPGRVFDPPFLSTDTMYFIVMIVWLGDELYT